jgi:hypothetical protein
VSPVSLPTSKVATMTARMGQGFWLWAWAVKVQKKTLRTLRTPRFAKEVRWGMGAPGML